MEILAWMAIIAITRLVTDGVKNTSAIMKGTEPPEITKFNARQKSGGVTGRLAAAVQRRGRSGKPAGPARQVYRAWKANLAAAAVEKATDRHHRRIQWYRDHGKTIQDDRWHARQQLMLRRKQQQLHDWKVRRGLVDADEQPHTVTPEQIDEPQQAPPELDDNVVPIDKARKGANAASAEEQPGENTGGQHDGQQAADKAGDTPPESDPGLSDGDQAGHTAEQKQKVARKPLTKEKCAASPSGVHELESYRTPSERLDVRCKHCHKDCAHCEAGGCLAAAGQDGKQEDEATTTTNTTTNTATNTTTSGGNKEMYDRAAEDLHRQAANIDSYCEDLAQLSDLLSGRGWGDEVTGPAGTMSGELVEAAGVMRDVANRMRHQGDNVRDAYEKAPFAPDKGELVRA